MLEIEQRGVRVRTVVRGLAVTMTVLISVAARGASCPDAGGEALGWLDKMAHSIHEVAYHGVVTFQRGDEMQVMQVSQSVSGGHSSGRLTQLTGQGAQIVRADHPLECIHPGHRLLRVGTELREGRCGVAAHYRFSVEDGERVAGRRAVNVRIRPLDMYRFGYLMALDEETGLLLKTETLGRGGKSLETFQFASLSYDGEDHNAQGVELVHEAHHPHPDIRVPAASPGRSWSINWLPAGFSATDDLQSSGNRQTYTDGLAVFSVFLERLDSEIRPGEGVVRRGGTTAYSRGLRINGEPVLVTVIGEVPLNTARMVADSLAWAQ